jgi:hypothetical protein
MSRSPLIGYPSGWTLAVVVDPEAADRAASGLVAEGIPGDAIVVITGDDGSTQLRRLGVSSGRLARLRRSVQFMTMDQLPDLFVYEAAIADGHPVIGVKAAGSRRSDAVAVLRRNGAHFINHFGTWMTTEIEPWHGRMPSIPQHMQR